MTQSSVESGLPANRHIKENSISYREFDIAQGHIMLTEAGNELLHNREVWSQIRHYIEEIKDPKELVDNPTRLYFREGGNAHIFLLGNLPLAIKEMSNSLAMRDTLTRLEELYRLQQLFLIILEFHYITEYSLLNA